MGNKGQAVVREDGCIALAVCWTQREYDDYIAAHGCVTAGMIYKLTDGANVGCYIGSGDKDVSDKCLATKDDIPQGSDTDLTTITPELLASGVLRITGIEGGNPVSGQASIKALLNCIKTRNHRELAGIPGNAYAIEPTTAEGVFADSIISVDFTVPADAINAVEEVDIRAKYGWRQTLAPAVFGESTVEIVYSLDGGAWTDIEWAGAENVPVGPQRQDIERNVETQGQIAGNFAPGSTHNVRFAIEIKNNADMSAGARLSSYASSGAVSFDYLCLVS